MNLLIVEDEPGLLKTISTYLSQSNFACDLGLSNIKQICESSSLKVIYKYDSGWHTFIIDIILL